MVERLLLDWYERNGRDLPWRKTRDHRRCQRTCFGGCTARPAQRLEEAAQLERTPAGEAISLTVVGMRSVLVRWLCLRLSQSPTTISHTGTRMNPKNPSGVRSDAPMTIVAHASGAGSMALRRAPRPVARSMAAKAAFHASQS